MNGGLPEGGRGKHVAAFARCHRLTKTDEFSSVFSFRKAFRSSHFLLHYRPRCEDETASARLGLVVGKRLLRRAVDRNLLRRLARESFRRIRPQCMAWDVVLRLATKPQLPLDRRKMAEEIDRLLNKLLVQSMPDIRR